jgi:N-acetylmuramoyl-L-alanine amidase
MPSIYISPSSQPANKYAVGNTNEQEQCRKIAVALKKALERCVFKAYAGMDGTMYTRADASNKLNVDLHLPIHTNAFDGKVAGLRIMVYNKGDQAEMIAKAIMKHLAPITPGESDGISAQPQLYEIKATKAICVYIEVGFHDNPEEAQWIINNTESIAEAIARGLCEYYGVAYVSPKTACKQFTDVLPSVWYANDVAYCVEHNLMQGDGTGKFRPMDFITRAEAATLIARLHKQLSK